MAKENDYVYDGVVLSVHDGDTVKVSTLLRRVAGDTPLGDLGFHCFIEDVHKPSWSRPQRWLTLHCPYRLLGINSPELNTAAGKEALAYIKGLVNTGSWVKVRSEIGKTIDPDKYGDRWLGVLVRTDGLVVNDEMVRAGHAKKWDGKGTKPV